MDYKLEIQNTREGCLGGSDGNLISQIASLGYVPTSAKKRLAVVKGLAAHTQIPQTPAVKFGDFIEQSIYEHLAQGDGGYQSNPMLVSKKYSRPSVKMIAHPDILRIDADSHTVYVYEVKATKHAVEQTVKDYRPQLFIESLLAKEYAQNLTGKWKIKQFLVHYNTEGLDLHKDFEFDPQRITLKHIVFRTSPFSLEKAMDLIDDYVYGLDFYCEEEVVDAKYLPEEVGRKFEVIAETLREIKEREARVDDFKTKLYDFLASRGIRKVKCEDFSFTVVPPSQSTSFDSNAFLSDFGSKYPRKVKKLREQYKKVSDRKGYVKISVS